MNISTFSQKFYIDAKTIKGIYSQHKFISDLFFAGGSEYFARNLTKEDKGYWTARSLYAGRRNLTPEMRESFPKKFDKKRFIEYFKDRITEKSLKMIAKNFMDDTDEIKKDLFLMALCKQFQAIIYDEEEDNGPETNLVSEEYKRLLQSPSITEQKNDIPVNSSNNDKQYETNKNSPVSLWLPDAELATEEQSGFESFTPTVSTYSFMNLESGIWGIISVKGVGKTYLLQKMRRDMNEYAIPHYHKLSKENEWGTESIRFDDPTLLEKTQMMHLAGLWKVSILCLVINCIESPDKKSKIDKTISRDKLSDDIIYILENPDLYKRLNGIINGILLDSNWRSTILRSYTLLSSLCKQIIENRDRNELIMLFIDKVDQSILQPGAEIPECNDCYKDTKYDDCKKRITT